VKNWIKITLWSIFGAGVIALLFVTQNVLQELPLKKTSDSIKIHVTGENSFLTEEELLTRLHQHNLIYVNQKVKDFSSEKVEQFIGQMEEVKNVMVYTSLDGTWNIDIVLRRPIARVFNSSGQSYYLDADGYTIGSSLDHTARVLVVTGDIPDSPSSESVDEIINNDSLITIRKLDDVYRISNYVCNDPLMQSLIGQVHRENTGDFVLIPLVGGQKIIFGSAFSDDEVVDKFEKLKIFYKEAIPFEGWDKYSEISLKYDKQIVCKKKE
jgi:cell division protein FtsQ